MEKLLPLLNFLMRFKFVRDKIIVLSLQPIKFRAALDQLARDMKANGLENIANATASLTLVCHVQLVPTRLLQKGAKLEWQIPATVRSVKAQSEQPKKSVLPAVSS
jgi:hypothetical protein